MRHQFLNRISFIALVIELFVKIDISLSLSAKEMGSFLVINDLLNLEVGG